jgi:hypothetical protein
VQAAAREYALTAAAAAAGSRERLWAAEEQVRSPAAQACRLASQGSVLQGALRRHFVRLQMSGLQARWKATCGSCGSVLRRGLPSRAVPTLQLAAMSDERVWPCGHGMTDGCMGGLLLVSQGRALAASNEQLERRLAAGAAGAGVLQPDAALSAAAAAPKLPNGVARQQPAPEDAPGQQSEHPQDLGSPGGMASFCNAFR